MTRLRDYQIDGIKAVRQAYDRGLYRVGVSLGTGLGKTMMMAAMASKVHSEGGRTLTLLHRDVLVEQTVRRYAQFIPPEQIGVVKASRNEIDRRVIIASVHTLRSDGRLQAIPRPDLTIVDEAHVSASDLYLDVFKHLDTVPGGAGFLAGFSATWSRSDDRSLGDIWQEVVFRRSIKWAVENNYLVPPRALQLGGSLDLSDVRIGSDGDFNERDLGKVVMLPDLKETVVRGYHQVAYGRSAVLFAPTQESARYFGDALRESGVNVAEVLASTGRNARRFAFAGFDSGAVKVLVTCTALSTGWDAPRCDTAIMLRPTRHAGTFVQMIGRVLRPWPSKSEALILDFVGVVDDKDMRSVIDLSPTEERIGRPECQVCG
ncbi:MAG: DEAD/DEAH box helicase, partial [Candidatus Binatia bacterium]